ncbi:DUF975 family protein [Alkaliphilus hydrothermalis]|uniref:Membrane protein n=1 Tax=Alkaliphilus hydrothermalis TaxID=1482730 RepID=A0ABS2NPT8_9FIRM|nr:DUF975 family protein [Alkaliphilus hydrothermalis]MBM7614963.1 putative membrane protein [Alkaliphilus hydrothermalis]
MDMHPSMIKENSQIRKEARSQLKGNWLMAILVYFVYGIITGLPGAIPLLGPIISIVLVGPLMLGATSCFLSLVRKNHFDFEELFDGFNNFVPAFLVYLIQGIFIFLWSLLLIIPGIIASLSYSMSFFILHDNPQMSAMDCIRASKAMMKGFKFKLFCLYFTIVGPVMLAIIVLIFTVSLIISSINAPILAIIFAIIVGLGSIVASLFLMPYLYNSVANFYENLKENQMQK